MYRDPTYLRKLGADEGLLHADPDGDRYEELLVGLLQLIGRRRQQLDPAEFRAVVAALLLAVPAHKQ